MTMICFDVKNACFNYRVAGIALRDNYVLLNKFENGPYWFLPGGRVEMGEASNEALRREMQEELQIDVQVGRLLWVAETFFRGFEKKNYHELGFYYMMGFPSEAPFIHASEPFSATDGHTTLIFQWFMLEEITSITLYPPFLIEGLRHVPEQTVHMLDGR